jgi:uncharacterized protein YegL
MRRLPVYLIIDTSGSMHGEPIEAVKTGIDTLVAALRTDPQALETAHLAVIGFNSEPSELAPLTELIAFNPPSLTAGGTTCLGAALKFAADAIHRDVRKTTAEAKGDWKPIIFLMTDGAPTDDWRAGLAAFKGARAGLVVACAAGADADTDVLKEITENVVALDTADGASLSAYFRWVSASISVSSARIDLSKSEAGGLGDLPPPPEEIRVVL